MMLAGWCLRVRRTLFASPNQNLTYALLRSRGLRILPRQLKSTLGQQCLCRGQSTASQANVDENKKSRGKSEENKQRARLVSVMVGSAVGFLGASFVLYRKLTSGKAHAQAARDVEDKKMEGLVDVNNKDMKEGIERDEEDSARKRKGRNGFRARRIIEYENRIRQYSTPDKVFRYFATLKVVHPGPEENEVFMAPEDFVRALTPGKMQPEGLGLDEHEKFNPEKHQYKGYESKEIGEESVFMKMGEYGLISFSDYIFLLTVLSLPPRLFEIAFQMFDLNGDGEVSSEEFEKVQSVLFSMTSTGSRHRDHSTTGSVLSRHVNSGLRHYLFGVDETQKLTVQNFVDFQRKLQNEVMYLEFMSYDPQDNKISASQFADMLLTYSSFSEKKKQQILKRVKKASKENPQGISFLDYVHFFNFLRNVNEAEVALSFHIAANKAIDPETFKRVASTITGVELRDRVIDVVYKMFDENDDGELSHKEFISVMKNQLVRGLENPKDTGFAKLMSATLHCAKHRVYQSLHPNKRQEHV